MDNIDATIAELKAKISKAQLNKVRAEATKDSAEKVYTSAMQKLKDEFDVDNLGQARDKLAQLQLDLRQHMDAVAECLSKINL